jgi:acyl-CoA dehydrogenase
MPALPADRPGSPAEGLASSADRPAWAALAEPEFILSVRQILGELTVAAERWERQAAVPAEAWRELGDRGLLGLGYPERLGGVGAPLGHSIAFLTELGRTGYAGFRAAVGVHAYMANRYLGEYADAKLQHRYLAAALTGRRIAALAITEPDAGSDLTGLAAWAEPDGADLRLNGRKTMVVNGGYADYFVVACRTDQRGGSAGLSLLVVDTDLSGVVVRPQHTLGWRSAAIAELTFTDVRVPASRLIGRAGGGFFLLMDGLQYERLAAAELALGGAEHCLQLLVDHLNNRSAHGRKLAGFQVVRHRIATLATELAAARGLVAEAVRTFDSTSLPVTECSMAKVYATELANRATDAYIQFSGSVGYLADTDAAPLGRDSRATTPAGPPEVLLDLIAEELLSSSFRRHRVVSQ